MSNTPETIISEHIKQLLAPQTLESLSAIKVNHLYGNRYRVNCYTKTIVEGSAISRNLIEESFFVALVDDTVFNLTPA
ncbi:MAG: hypothetical protein GY906_04875 [bacterium]|nr:hypothetical protein [bacterium]